MRIKLFCIGVLLLAITFNSCVKKTFNAEVVVPATDTLNITATVVGRVIDEAGIPVANAIVKSPSTTISTNVNGEFSFTNIPLNDYAAYVTAAHVGYFNGARTFMARQGQKHYIEIQLKKKSPEGIISSTTGGIITLTSGASFALPPNAVMNQATGAKYTGDVHIALSWIDPTQTNGGRQFPGANRGINTAGNEMGIESFGILGIELTGNSGEILQIDTPKSAVITMPIPATLVQYAPTSKVELWSFNESSGFWNQQGTAIKSGGNFIATITHCATWNCGAAINGVRFTATVRDTKNNPLTKTLVRVKRVYTNSYIYAFTDTSGVYASLVPFSEPLTIEVMGTGSCSSTVLFTQNIGPYNSATADAGVVYVNNLGSYGNATIYGNVVNCANKGLAAGYIYFNLRGLSYQTPIINGAYSISIPMCVSSDTISYYVLDQTDTTVGHWTNAVVYAGQNHFSNIVACKFGNNPTVPNKRFIYFYIDSVSGASVDSINTLPDSTTGFLVGNVLPAFTTIYGSKSASNNISFNFPGVINGSYILSNLYINHPFLKNNNITSTNIAVNITSYATTIGGFISGSFNGSFGSDTTHQIYGIFQVRRDY